MNPRDSQFRDSVSLLKQLARYSPQRLNICARENNLPLRTINEDYRQFIGRIWTRITGRSDFDMAYSTLMLIESFRGETIERKPDAHMRESIARQIERDRAEIEREENRTDADFMGLLRQV
jgi:hypothetical protein